MLDGDTYASWLDERLHDTQHGDIFAEISAKMQENEDVANAFAYAFSFKNDNAQRAKEIFAELLAHTLLEPALIQENLPNAFDYIQAVIQAEGLNSADVSSGHKRNDGKRGKTLRSTGRETESQRAEPKQKLGEYFTGLLGGAKNAFLSAFSEEHP
jgi:hypothetical protein